MEHVHGSIKTFFANVNALGDLFRWQPTKCFSVGLDFSVVIFCLLNATLDIPLYSSSQVCLLIFVKEFFFYPILGSSAS